MIPGGGPATESQSTALVFLNDRFVPYEAALVPVEDRGFQFADGVYEVVRLYGGHPFRLDDHIERLEQSCTAIRLPLPLDPGTLHTRIFECIRLNVLDGVEGIVYIQVTRGVAPRQHLFPQGVPPTLVILARKLSPSDPTAVRDGVRAILVPDRRGNLCSIKSIALLPNVLAKQEAAEAGAFEAIFARDGVVTEGASTNVFALVSGTLRTHPEGPQILSGVTRRTILELAQRLGIPTREAAFRAEELEGAGEAFLSATTFGILPLVEVDGNRIGTGRPGEVTEMLRSAFEALVRGRDTGSDLTGVTEGF